MRKKKSEKGKGRRRKVKGERGKRGGERRKDTTEKPGRKGGGVCARKPKVTNTGSNLRRHCRGNYCIAKGQVNNNYEGEKGKVSRESATKKPKGTKSGGKFQIQKERGKGSNKKLT